MGKYSVVSVGQAGGFDPAAAWGFIDTGGSISSDGLAATGVAETNNIESGGNAFSAVPANVKVYMEFHQDNGLGMWMGSGFHSGLSSNLTSPYYRFWVTNLDTAPPRASNANAKYLGSNSNTTQYFGGAEAESPVDFDGTAVLAGIGITGWAIDTINDKVWVRCTGTNSGSYDDWIGGGNPETGTSPTFTADFTGLYFYGTSFYVSGGGVSALTCNLRLSASQQYWTAPGGFVTV
jgi:hypothetical protein